MLINLINTYAPRIPLKVAQSIGYAILACLTFPFDLAGYKNFNYFRRKAVEIWNENKTETTIKANKVNPNKVELELGTSPALDNHTNVILDQWVEDAPTEEEKEDRVAARQKIQIFFTKERHSLDLVYRKLTSLPDIFNSPSFSNLQTLNLNYCRSLTTLPASFGSNLPALQTLHLRECSSLTTLPESFGSNLPALQTLHLSDCSSLTTLPESFGSNLLALQTLNLSDCSSLTTLPESFGNNLPALQTLHLRGCCSLITLPASFGSNLLALQMLNLRECSSLTTLPESFGSNLPALQTLNLRECSSLTTLPESFGSNLPALQTLNLSDCSSLTTLPESFGSNLPALQTLNLRECSSLTTLPESFGSNLLALRMLYLSDNQSLQGIPMQMLELPSHCTIDLTGCSLSVDIRERLREVMSSPNYTGPRISYSMVGGTSRTEEKSIQESLKGLYQIIGETPTEFTNLTKTEELRSWLNRLSDTADYKTGGDLRKAFAEKIIAYLSQANENTEFRSAFYAIIEDASATCGDRVALSVLHLNIAYQLATIDLKDMKKLADFLIKGPWAIQMLEGIARNKVSTLPFFDEIEVYLGYPIKLKEELQIPIDTQEMLYFTCSALTSKDLEEAKNFVLDKQKEPFEFLINNAKWQEALSANYSKEYQAIVDKKAEAAEADDPDYISIEKKYKQDLIELTKKVLES